MEIDAGGPSAVGHGQRDLYNYEAKLREEQRGHDAEALIEHFAFEKEKNPNFFYAFETDSDNKLVRCFWADSESRRSYVVFGDAIVFDTTYNTNKYLMIFAPFVGVNHHSQTVLFACGLLSDETTETVVWLLSKFVESMLNNKPLGVIITDQDAAISKAISMILPYSMHRYCLWHILNKFSEKINAMLYNEQYHNLVNIIKLSESPDEFEHRWNEVMESTNLDCNEWLSTMYEIRSRWVPAYVKHIFSAGMSSSQRSESGHSFLKKFINRNCSLMGFITRFNRALVHQRNEELCANHIDITEQPMLNAHALMEQQMVHIYTKKIFLKFQKEVGNSNFYMCSKKSGSVDTKVYSVQRFELGKTFDRQREVTFYTSNDYVCCSCHMFEFEGCPCRHMLSFFKKKQIFLLPDKYILLRWTKNAKDGTVFNETTGLSVGDGTSRSLMARHGMLSHKASELVDHAALTDSRSTFLMAEFEGLHIRLKDIDAESPVGMSNIRSRSIEGTHLVCDPNPVRAKGCGKRLKSSKEKAMSKSSRQCRLCGVQGHDKRTCPRRGQDSVDVVTPDPYFPSNNYYDPHDTGGNDGNYTSISNSYPHGGSGSGFF